MLILHSQEYVVTVKDEFDLLKPSSFSYTEQESFTVTWQRILRNPRLLRRKGQISDHTNWTLGKNLMTADIHLGYCRLLVGFLREIEFVANEGIEDDRCTFRAQYLIKVLDAFVNELVEFKERDGRLHVLDADGRTKNLKPEYFFQSQVLNPILQRQLRGVPDNEPDKVKLAVGTTLRESMLFYLEHDPLDPRFSKRLLRNMLYIAPVHFSLAFYKAQACDKEALANIRRNTEFLEVERSKHAPDAWDESTLHNFEIEVIKREALQGLYELLIKDSVSGGFLAYIHAQDIEQAGPPEKQNIDLQTLSEVKRNMPKEKLKAHRANQTAMDVEASPGGPSHPDKRQTPRAGQDTSKKVGANHSQESVLTDIQAQSQGV